MDQPPKKRGRPRVFRTEDVVERRRLAKKRSNDSRRILKVGSVLCGGSQEVATPTVRGCGVVDGGTGRGEGLPDHGPTNVPPVEGEIHQDVNAGTGENTGESKRMRKSIDQRKKQFWENNIVLDVGRQEETCGFCAAKVKTCQWSKALSASPACSYIRSHRFAVPGFSFPR